VALTIGPRTNGTHHLAVVATGASCHDSLCGVGWGECSDSRNPFGVVGCVRDFEELLLGEDARAIERRPRPWHN